MLRIGLVHSGAVQAARDHWNRSRRRSRPNIGAAPDRRPYDLERMTAEMQAAKRERERA
jgi:hypothetical protein